MNALAIAGLGTTELLIIFGVIILLFGAAKLPELARGSGRALRIFKTETKGLMDDDDTRGESADLPDDTASTTPTTTRPLPSGTTSAEQVDTSESARRSDPA